MPIIANTWKREREREEKTVENKQFYFVPMQRLA